MTPQRSFLHSVFSLHTSSWTTILFPFETAPPSVHMPSPSDSLAGSSLSTSCCSAHLVLGDPPGRGVDAKLLQRVDDLASGADRDSTVKDKMQVVDTGILGTEEKEEDGMMSVR